MDREDHLEYLCGTTTCSSSPSSRNPGYVSLRTRTRTSHDVRQRGVAMRVGLHITTLLFKAADSAGLRGR